MSAIAARYARALADVVTAAPGGSATAEAVDRELSEFQQMLASSGDLRNILASPAVKGPRKRAVIEQLGARAGLSKTGRNFLFVLSDNRRMAMLPEVLRQFRAEIDERMGLVEARITSAAAMDGAQRSALENALARKTGRRIRAAYAVDPVLVGGAVARVGSTIYDGSVREQLRLLREKLSS